MAEAQEEKKKPAKKAKPEGEAAAAKPKAAKPAGDAPAKAKPEKAKPADGGADAAAEKAAHKAAKKAAKKARPKRLAKPLPVRHARALAPAPAPRAKSDSKVTVTQIASPIGRQGYQRETLKGLGLNKLRRTRTLEDTPEVRGMIDRVRHLVRVEAG